LCVRLGPSLTGTYSSGLGWSTLMRFARLRAEYATDSRLCVKRSIDPSLPDPL
jgi:hypothetical protein